MCYKGVVPETLLAIEASLSRGLRFSINVRSLPQKLLGSVELCGS